MHRIPIRFAILSILAVLSIILVYHSLIISGQIPYEAVWGGRLESREQMLRFESVSILINLFIIGITLVKWKSKPTISNSLLLRILFFLLFLLFLLNTLGNIFSENFYEALVFTPVTMFLAVMCFRLSRSDLERDRVNP